MPVSITLGIQAFFIFIQEEDLYSNTLKSDGPAKYGNVVLLDFVFTLDLRIEIDFPSKALSMQY